MKDQNKEIKKPEGPEKLKANSHNESADPQQREQQARKQQEQTRSEGEPHSSDAKDALRQKTRQGLNNR